MKTTRLRFLVLMITLCACSTPFLPWTPIDAANILAVQTHGGKSNWNMMRAVLRALTDRGHNVTVFTPFLDGDRPFYTEVDVSDAMVMRVGMNVSHFKSFQSTRTMIAFNLNSTRNNCGTIFEHPRMRELFLDSRSHSIEVVVAHALISDCVSYAATVLRVPVIYVVPPPIITYTERSFFGHVANPAAVSNLLFHRSVPKKFVDRFANTLQTIYVSWILWQEDRRLRESDPRPFDAVDLAKPSVIFTNTHFITEPSRPLTPDVVQIGGIHLTPPGPIPKDILEFIDVAPHGVIYFTLGSTILMTSLPENVQSALREALFRVPQKVLWKYEGEMTGIPKNVMIRKWFPQRDILLHPNMKLFISHGGISGVYEAVDAAVPVLGFPLCFDQPRNIDNLVDAGMAISMDLFSVTKETFLNAILEIVNNDRYQKNAKITSERFKDRPMSPAESVVYWTEYILRHKGASHLKSHALNLQWYEYFLIDVIITFLFIWFIVYFIIYYSLKMICKHISTLFNSVKEKRE